MIRVGSCGPIRRRVVWGPRRTVWASCSVVCALVLRFVWDVCVLVLGFVRDPHQAPSWNKLYSRGSAINAFRRARSPERERGRERERERERVCGTSDRESESEREREREREREIERASEKE